MRKRWRVLAIGGVAVVAGAVLLLGLRARNGAPRYTTIPVDRGDIADVVGATGVLQAVTTVQVGSQVSGTIANLNADFNSVVKKGQVVARLDPSLFQARVAQARANLVAAEANVERLRATVEDTRQKYQRAQELSKEHLLPESDLETAKANHDSARAQLRAGEAAVSQSEAALNQAQVDLGHTVIAAPIDGVVVARNVDVGQTVAASLQAPTLFVIANDLSRMQVNASIDEADIGRVRTGQKVSFRVDAYPERTFEGTLQQIRLQPITNQNVVTYNTIIDVANPEMKLMPGMTATVTVVVESRDDVVRVPATALRFRPADFEERRASWSADSSRAGDGAPAAAGAAGERRGRRRGPGGEGAPAGTNGGERGPGRPGLVFVLQDGRPQPVRVRLGLSDGRYVEALSGLTEGTTVVVEDAAARAAGPRPGASPATNPFTPQRPQRRTR
jgi:HlyD family secretion protein